MKKTFLTWTRVILLPVLYFLSVLFLLLMFLSPRILSNQMNLVTIAPGFYVAPANTSWNGDGPTIRLGLLGSCSQANNSAPLQCQGPSVMPKYDYSVLRTDHPKSPEISAVATSAVWMAMCLICWGVPIFYFLPVWVRWHNIDKVFGGHRFMAILAISAGFGYILGAMVFFITYFNLMLRVDLFDQEVGRLGPDGPIVQAFLGPGFAFGGSAFGLGIPVLSFMIIDAAKLSGWTSEEKVQRKKAEEGKKAEWRKQAKYPWIGFGISSSGKEGPGLRIPV